MNELFGFWSDWMHYTLFDWNINRIQASGAFLAIVVSMLIAMLENSPKPLTHFLIGTCLLAVCTALWPITLISLIAYGIVFAIEQLREENKK